MIALTVAGKSVRDALFCAYFPATDLPKAMTGGALLSVLTALAASRIFRAFGPVRSVMSLLFASALGFALEHAAFETAPRTVALILYLHVSAVAGLVVSGFWSVVNERFDPRTLRLAVARIGLGASVGGFLGALAAERVSAWTEARHTLLALCMMSACAALPIWLLRTRAALAPPVPQTPRNATLDSRYLRDLALFVGLTALASSAMDFAFKARAMEHFRDAAALVKFFSIFYMAVSVTSFLVQCFATPPLLDKAGLGVALAGLPGVVAISGLFALLVPGLGTQTFLRGADGALTSSLFRSAYEPLYTPLSEDRKRSTKSLIDVMFDKLGDALGSALCWGLVLLVPTAAIAGATLSAVLLAVGTFVLAARLYQGYVVELAASLRSGVTVLDDSEVHDRTTRLTLSQTLGHLDRNRLLGEIEQLQKDPPPAERLARALGNDALRSRTRAETSPLRGLPLVVSNLLSRDPERVRSALRAVEPPLATLVIPLVERDDVGAEAMQTLGRLAEHITGQLADALLDHRNFSPTVRRRLVRVLTNARGERAAAALARALQDPDFDVRVHVEQGLEEMLHRGVASPVTRETAVSVATRELSGEEAAAEKRADHALGVLGLAFDPEAFRLARSALSSKDERLRGTALEYLENVLPAPVCSLLFAALLVEGSSGPRRKERDLFDELRRGLRLEPRGGEMAPSSERTTESEPPRGK